MIVAERDEEQREHLMRFFKTGPGQYGEGDMFLGLKVPVTRAIVRKVHKRVELEDLQQLLDSEWHEVRLCGLLILVEMMKANLPKRSDDAEELSRKKSCREAIAKFYLANARQANNWDLVDLSCQYILGPYLRLDKSGNFDLLMKLAESDNLWEQRISIVTTLDFIRNGITEPTLILADKLIGHHHDLIHKAIGWTLREVGKKNESVLIGFLETHYMEMPRTALRYAIERLPEPTRQYWLHRK
ncbi:MAG: DNA alkylation repair protein [Muribaculaceae bacterium]|nr:DNA alkylation repair protein [Muribaculaceae bacterium]